MKRRSSKIQPLADTKEEEGQFMATLPPPCGSPTNSTPHNTPTRVGRVRAIMGRVREFLRRICPPCCRPTLVISIADAPADDSISDISDNGISDISYNGSSDTFNDSSSEKFDEISIIDDIVPTALSLNALTFNQVINDGSHGKVLLATHPACYQPLAVKMIRKEHPIEKFIETIDTQLRIVEDIGSHPFSVRTFGTFQTMTDIYFVMEYLPGGDLYKFLMERAPLDVFSIRFITAEILCGLQFLHRRGIIHRNLKPSNILMDNGGHIKISDFGQSKTGVSLDTKLIDVVGTATFMAPEVMKSAYNTTADYYSLGVIVYMMAVGAFPFISENIEDTSKTIMGSHSYPANIDPMLQDLIEKLLCEDPQIRQQFVNDIREHPFFSEIDWVMLEAGKMCPPYEIKAPLDIDMSQTIAVEDLYLPRKSDFKGLICGFSTVTKNWKVMQQLKQQPSPLSSPAPSSSKIESKDDEDEKKEGRKVTTSQLTIRERFCKMLSRCRRSRKKEKRSKGEEETMKGDGKQNCLPENSIRSQEEERPACKIAWQE